MKELSVQEMDEVSGGLFGFITAPIGGLLGGAIGAIVDAGCAVGGLKTNFAFSGVLLGAGIGAAVGFAPIMATAGIGFGVTSIVQNGLNIHAQKGMA